MSDSIGSLLSQRELFEPPEIKIIQNFVQQKFNVTPGVSLSDKQIVIAVKSAALAGALRPLLLQIKDACATEKRLVIRIQ